MNNVYDNPVGAKMRIASTSTDQRISHTSINDMVKQGKRERDYEISENPIDPSKLNFNQRPHQIHKRRLGEHPQKRLTDEDQDQDNQRQHERYEEEHEEHDMEENETSTSSSQERTTRYVTKNQLQQSILRPTLRTFSLETEGLKCTESRKIQLSSSRSSELQLHEGKSIMRIGLNRFPIEASPALRSSKTDTHRERERQTETQKEMITIDLVDSDAEDYTAFNQRIVVNMDPERERKEDQTTCKARMRSTLSLDRPVSSSTKHILVSPKILLY
jgi:hypothetical protein